MKKKSNKRPKPSSDSRKERYLISDLIGTGAFGSVYSAFDSLTGKTVAMKCLISQEGIEDFQEELDLLKRLSHEAIVPYLDSYLDDKGSLFIVMEYAEGGSLLDIVKTYGTLSESIAAVFCLQILKGLEYLHNQGIIHRDIKAANVLIQGGVAKLADFGLAFDLVKYGKTLREIAGSPYWMAPEVINGDPVNCKCDIWSVGATIIELLTGKAPFFDLPPLPAMFQIGGSRPIPLPRNVSDLCREFLSLCLNKDSKLRPNASELINHKWLLSIRQEFDTCKNQKQINQRIINDLAIQSIKSATFKSMSLFESKSAIIPSRMAPETVLSMINESDSFNDGVLFLLRDCQQCKRIPQLFMNICGVRIIYDNIMNNNNIVGTTNLISFLSSISDQFSASAIQQGLFSFYCNSPQHLRLVLVQLLLDCKNICIFLHSNKILRHIFDDEDPLIQVFIPYIFHLVYVSPISTVVRSSIIEQFCFIKKMASLMIRVLGFSENYYNTLKSQYGVFELNNYDISQNPSLLPTKMIEIAKNTRSFLLQYISVLFRPDNNHKGAILQNISPILYIIKNRNKFVSITDSEYHNILNVCEKIITDSICSYDSRYNEIIPSLVNLIEADSIFSPIVIRVLAHLCKSNSEYINTSIYNGVLSKIESIAHEPELSLIINEFICLIPTYLGLFYSNISDCTLIYRLFDLLNSSSYSSKAFKALSKWAQKDPKNFSQFIQIPGLSCILKSHISLSINDWTFRCNDNEQLNDLYNMFSNANPSFSSIIDIDILTSICSIISEQGAFTQVLLLDTLFCMVYLSNTNKQILSSFLINLKPLMESSILLVQKMALRIKCLCSFDNNLTMLSKTYH